MVEAVGALVIFLPPYCPQLNPIELAFNSLKNWIKRYASHAYKLSPVDVLSLALANCTKQMINENSGIKALRHCDYMRDGMLEIEVPDIVEEKE